MEYEDNPYANLDYLKTLNPSQTKYYVTGYLMACTHIREAFTKTRTSMLTKLLAVDDDVAKLVLLDGVNLLDYYEDIVKKKEHSLRGLFPEVNSSTQKFG